MAQAFGTGNKKSLNVELNIIPFIDLLSCLTAFLMATAMWIDIAQLEIKPAGQARGERDCVTDDCRDPRLSVLIGADEIWIGVSRLDRFESIPRLAAGHDWARLEGALRLHKTSALFEHETAIEIAADSTDAHPIRYQDLVATMDVAVKAGFVDVGVTDPSGLSARPSL